MIKIMRLVVCLFCLTVNDYCKSAGRKYGSDYNSPPEQGMAFFLQDAFYHM